MEDKINFNNGKIAPGDKITPNDKLSRFKKLSDTISVPKLITNLFRSEEELEELRNREENLGNPLKINNGFDNLTTLFVLFYNKIIKLTNIINDNQESINRNSIKIDKKNDKINFYSASDTFPENPEFTNSSNPLLKKLIKVNSDPQDPETEIIDTTGIIVDEDSGLELIEIKTTNISTGKEEKFVKLNFDLNLLKTINFITSDNSPVKISWDESIKGYKVEQNDILVYESSEPETEIIIDHNLGTRGLDVKVFKILDNDLDMKYQIQTGIEYPSDNQVRIYLCSPLKVHVVISRL